MALNIKTISSDRKYDIIKFMRSKYPDVSSKYKDNNDGNKQLYELAETYFPKYKFDPWQDDEVIYSQNPTEIDTSPAAVDTLLTYENTVNQAMEKAKDMPEYQPVDSVAQPPNLDMTADMVGKKPIMQRNAPVEMPKRSDFELRPEESTLSQFAITHNLLPDRWKTNLKINYNNTAAGHNYQIRTGEDKYDVDPEDYDAGFLEGVALNFIGMGIPEIASYGAGGGVAKLAQPAIKYAPKALKWAWNATVGKTGLVNKITPKSKMGIKIQNIIGQKFSSDAAIEQMASMGISMGTTFAALGAIESAANQRIGRGKYQGNNGTINPWDVAFDGTMSFGEGAAFGSILGFSNNAFDKIGLYAKPRWMKGKRDAKTVASTVLSNPVVKYGSHGITFASLPLLYDDERRKQYVDKDGNIKYGQYFGDVLTGSGISLAFVGLSRAGGYAGNVPNIKKDFNAKNFLLKLTDKERKVLRQKSIELRQGKGKDLPFEEWSKTVDKGLIADLIRGRADMPVSLLDKMKAGIGFRPRVLWDRKSKVTSSRLPKKLSLPENLKDLRNQLNQDIKYEKKKSIDKALQSEESKMMTQSLNNVSQEMGASAPFSFFEKSLSNDTKSIETQQGLTSVLNVINKSLDIIDKIAITDKEGGYIGVDNAKLTDDDAYFLQFETPKAIPSYQGYKKEYLETDEGRDSYIKRFEVEELGGKKVTESQRKAILIAAESQIKNLDVVRDYMNRKYTEGDTPNENLQVKAGAEPELHAKKINVMLAQGGKLTDNKVYTVDEAEGIELINNGLAIKTSLKIKEAKPGEEQPVQPLVKQSNNFGSIDYDKLAGKVVQKMEDTGAIKGSVRENTPLTERKLQEIEKNIQGNELADVIAKPSDISNIKNKYDIHMLTQTFTDTELNKHLKDINKLLTYTKKSSIADITKKDVENWFDSLKKNRQKAGSAPRINTNETTALSIIFKGLTENKHINVNPAPETILKRERTLFYKIGKTSAKKQLPKLLNYYKGIDKIKLDLDKKDKKLSVALDLINTNLIRPEELNRIKGKHLTLRTDGSGDYELNARMPEDMGGIAKSKGVYRPVFISKELGKKIEAIIKNTPNGMETLLFPKYANKITQVLKNKFGKGVTSFSLRKQMQVLAERSGIADLTLEEREIFNLMSGHSEPESKGSMIRDLYKNQQDFETILDLQKDLLIKLNDIKTALLAPEKTTQAVIVSEESGGIESAVGKVIKKAGKKLEDTAGGVALSIEDVSGKNSRGVLKTVSSKKVVPKMDNSLKKKYVQSIKNTFAEFTTDMTSAEKQGLLKHFAREAGIEDFDNFEINLKSNTEDLVFFSEQLVVIKPKDAPKQGKVFKVIDNNRKAKSIAESNNISVDEQLDIIKRLFRKNKFLDLTPKESTEYLNYIKSVTDEIDTYYWQREGLNEANFIKKLKLSNSEALKIRSGFAGDARDVFRLVEKKIGQKGLSKIADDMYKHLPLELEVQGFFEDFEYKSKLALAPKTNLIGKRGKVLSGGALLNKVKDDIFWIQGDVFKQLEEHVALYPEHKGVVSDYKKAKKFYDKVYDKEGNLRIDTPESRVAKYWYELMDKIQNKFVDGFKANMTEAEWKTFSKDYPVNWIKDTFYVHKKVTQEFADAIDLNAQAFEKLVLDNQKSFAYKLAVDKHGKNPNATQVSEMMDLALTDAYNALYMMQEYAAKKVNPKYLLSRKLKLPPYIVVDGKPIKVWATDYSQFATNYVAGASKLAATITHMPYMIKMQGLPGNFKSIPIALTKIQARGGDIGKYVSYMIHKRVGINISNMGQLAQRNLGVMKEMNHYVSRAHLSFFTSSLKNLGIGTSMNNMAFGPKTTAVALARALSFENRMEAKGKGLIQLSLSAMEKKSGIANTFFELMFKSGGFGTSEMITRLTAAYAGLMEMPQMADGVRRGDKYWTAKAKDFYELDNEQMFLLKEYGLGTIDIGLKNINKSSLDSKRLKEIGTNVKLFNGKTTTDPYIIAREQGKLDGLHQKIITMAHINTQGATAEIFQPFMTQQPFLKEGMMYSQMAIAANRNISNIIRVNSKNNNWYRSFFGGAGAAGSWAAGHMLTGYALLSFASLVSTLPNPNDLEKKKWKKVLNLLIKGEFLGFFTPVLSLPAKGELPKLNDYISLAQLSVTGNAFALLSDLGRYGLDEAGIKPKGSKPIEQWMRNYSKFPKDAINSFGKSLFANYRNIEAAITNRKHPYNAAVETLKKLEKSYFNKSRNARVQIQAGNEMAKYNYHVKELFNKSDNYPKIAEGLMAKFWALYGRYKDGGIIDDEKAAQDAMSELNQGLKRLDPLSIGVSTDGRLMSKNDEFILDLMNLGESQGNIFKYTDLLAKTRKQYNTKIDSVQKAFGYLWSRNDTLKNDEFKKYWKTLKPSTWDALGIKLENGKYEIDLEDAIKKALEERKKSK